MNRRTTKFEKNIRVEKTRQMLLTGSTRGDVMQFAKETWGVSKRTIDGYMSQARKINEDILRKSQEESLAEQVSIRKNLRSIAHEKKNYHLEFRIAQDEAKLLGLYKQADSQYIKIDSENLTLEQLTRLLIGEPVSFVLKNKRLHAILT